MFFFWLSATLWPFDEISQDRRTRTLTLEHPVPKSLSNIALLKYYGCLLFFKCSQMYPTKDLFQVLKRSQKSLFIFTVMHRQKNIGVVNLDSTLCVRSGIRPSACDLCDPPPQSTLIHFGERRRRMFRLLPLLSKGNILKLRQQRAQALQCSFPLPCTHPTPQRAKALHTSQALWPLFL